MAKNTQSLSDIKESLDFQDNRIGDLEAKQEAAKLKSDQYERDIATLKETVLKLERETNSLERYTRGFNLRFVKIAEEPDENCRNTLSTLINDHLGIRGDMVENAHRTGTKKDAGPRHIIARFYSRVDRNRVIRAARTADPRPPFIVLDDLSPNDLAEKQRLSRLMKHLYETGKRPRFHAGRLYSNGRVLPAHEVDTLLSALPNDG